MQRPAVMRGHAASELRSDGQPAPEERADENSRTWRLGEILATALTVACFIIMIECRYPPELTGWFPSQWIMASLVCAPSMIAFIVGMSVLKYSKNDFELVRGSLRDEAGPREHIADDAVRWEAIWTAIKKSWDYERARILQSHKRRRLHALIFGALATLGLTCSVLALLGSSWAGDEATVLLSYSAIAAIATAFLTNLARAMLRICGGDATSRTLAWATRSLALVIIADIGLFVILDHEMSHEMREIPAAMLLGAFVGSIGDHAIQFLLDKGAKRLGTGKAAVKTDSPLLAIEGMTEEHVERLEEEGILSIHDLAFAPTARLFFATPYCLQQICDWQDRALLLVYVGKRSAEALAQKVQIRGAIDLRAFTHDISVLGSDPKVARIRESLRKALDLDEGGFSALLDSMMHDEVTMRIRYYWTSVVGRVGGVEASREIRGSVSDHERLQDIITDLTLEVTAEGFGTQQVS